MTWEAKTPEFGDIIRTKVSFYYHYGIFVDENQVIQFGLPENVSQPADTIHVLQTDVYRFLNGGELEVGVPEREERKKMRSAREIVEIAIGRMGEGGYDILHNNCEHFVNDCAFGAPHSSFLSDVRLKLRKKLNKA